MKLKKTILLSLLAGAVYASTASAALMCEYMNNGTSACEAITTNSQVLNTYNWSILGSGNLSGGGAFRMATCYSGSCTVKVDVIYPNGSTSNWERTVPSSRPFYSPGGGGGAWGGNPGGCTGTHIGAGCG